MVGILLLIAGLFVLALLFPGIFMTKEEDPFDRGENKDDPDLIVVDNEEVWIDKK